MGHLNTIKIKKYYANPNFHWRVDEFNLWSSYAGTGKCSPYDDGAVRIIFGGQIIKGRRIDLLIDFLAKISTMATLNIKLDIFSEGIEFEKLKLKFEYLQWVEFKPSIPRSDYRESLLKYHIGALVTDPWSDLPTFPSKVIDYVGAGLYVLALVEPQSELFPVFEGFKRIFVNSFDTSEAELNLACDFINAVKHDLYSEEIEVLREKFDIDKVIDKFIQ